MKPHVPQDNIRIVRGIVEVRYHCNIRTQRNSSDEPKPLKPEVLDVQNPRIFTLQDLFFVAGRVYPVWQRAGVRSAWPKEKA